MFHAGGGDRARSRSRRCAGSSGSAATPATGGCGAGGRKAAPGSSSGRGRRAANPRAVAPELLEACLDAAAPASDLGTGEGQGGAGAAHPGWLWPAASTIGELFAREGLTARRKRRRRTPPGGPLFAADAPNDVWTHGLQGLVPHRRRRALRHADARRRLQPLPAALPGGGAPRRRACLADPRRRLPRVWAAARLRSRQRPALRDDGRRRAVPALGHGDQGRRASPSGSPRASRRRTAGSSGCT